VHGRFENRQGLLEGLGARLLEQTAQEWESSLRPLGVAAGAVKDLGEALEGDLASSRDMIVSVETPSGVLRMVGNPIHTDAPSDYTVPPRLHEHTDEVFSEDEP